MRRIKYFVGITIMMLILACTLIVTASAAPPDLDWYNVARLDSGSSGGVYVTGTDDTVEDVKEVPEYSLSYAELGKIGGMTYKSTNLMPLTYADGSSKTSYGVSFAVADDYGVSATGTASGGVAIYYLMRDVTLPVGTYVANIGGRLDRSDGTTTWIAANTPFTVAAGDTLGYLYITVTDGTTIDNTIYPMLVAGNTLPAEYVAPYIGLRSSAVTEIRVTGKNLLPEDWRDASNWIEIDANKRRYIFDLPNGTYTVSAVCDESYASRYLYFYRSENGGVTWTSAGQILTHDETNPITFEVTDGVTYSLWSVNVALISVIESIQIERGDTATVHAPYTETTTPIPAAVQSLPGYGQGINETHYNYLEWTDDGRVLYHQLTDRIVLDGTEDWRANASEAGYYYLSLPGVLQAPILCNYVNTINTSNFMALYAVNNVLRLQRAADAYPTLDDWVSYLQSKAAAGDPAIVEYVLATPAVTDITDLMVIDNLITVEELGTVTLVNEYGYDVPNEITWYTMPQDCDSGHWYGADDICVVCGFHRPPPVGQAVIGNILGGFKIGANATGGFVDLFDAFIGTGGELTAIASVALSLAGLALVAVVGFVLWRKFTNRL